MRNRPLRSMFSWLAVGGILWLSVSSAVGEPSHGSDQLSPMLLRTNPVSDSAVAAKAAQEAEEQARIALGDHPLPRADAKRQLSPGDNCADPLKVDLTAGGVTLTGLSTCGRGNDYDETCLGYYDGGEDLIIELTVIDAGRYGIFLDPEGSRYTGILLSRSCPASSDCIATSVKSTAQVHGMQCLWLEAGVYYVMVDSWPAPECIPTFSIEFMPMACDLENDDCENAEPIGYTTDHPFTTAGATFDGPGECMIAPNIWYLYTPQDWDFVTISLCGSTYDTKLAVYDGADCATASLIACDDDACSLQSEVRVEVQPGHEYLIEVGGYNESSGEGIMSIFGWWSDPYQCPDGMSDEGEPCGDSINDGCNVDPPAFGSITCGESVCGNLWAENGRRDTDWYLLELDEPSDVSAVLESDWEAVVGLVPFDSTGVIDCDLMTGMLMPCDTAWSYLAAEITFTRPPGTYAIFVAPLEYDDFPCEGLSYDYGLTVTCSPHDSSWCQSAGGCDEHISHVTIGDIDNASDCDGYSDFTSMSTAMEPGEEYPFTVTTQGGYAGDDFAIWVDWNHDYMFYGPGERIPIEAATGYGPFTGVITVPEDAVLGPTTMRLRLSYFGTTADMDPCGVTGWGEVEDYTVLVTEHAAPVWLQEPDPFMVFHKCALYPIPGKLLLSNDIMPDADVAAWNNVQLRVGDCTIPLTHADVLSGGYGELEGDVLLLQFLERDFIECVEAEIGGLIWDTIRAGFTVDFETDAGPGSWAAEALIRGLRSGDLDFDGSVNVGDVTLLVSYLFRGEELAEPALADVDASGSGNVSDLTWLIAYLFKGGPPPTHN